MYRKLFLGEMFQMSREIDSALQKFMEHFFVGGISNFQSIGDNIPAITNTLLVVCGFLSEVREFPTKTPDWVFERFSQCSCVEFASVFEHVLKNQRVNNLYVFCGIQYGSNTMLRQVQQQ